MKSYRQYAEQIGRTGSMREYKKEETKVLVGQTVIPVMSAPVNVSIKAVSSGSAQYNTIKLIIRKID